MVLTLDSQLRRDEGNPTNEAGRSILYYDSMQVPTVGVGFNLREGLYQEEVDFILANRIKLALKDLLHFFPWVEFLDEVRRNALLNMTYNMGISRLSKFDTFLSLMEQKKFEEAATDLYSTVWHSQLPARSSRIIEQIKSGVMV